MPVAAPTANRLEVLLSELDIFSETQVQDLIARQRESRGSLTEIVEETGYAEEEAFLKALASVMDLPYVEIGDAHLDAEVLQQLPTKAVFQYQVIPVSAEDHTLRVAVPDPFVPGLTDALRLVSGRRIRLALCPRNEIEKAAKKYYGVGADTIERMIADDRIEVSPEDELGATDLSELDQEASIVKFVNQIIWEAHQDHATDIHMEPMENELRIRYRVDGVLIQTPVPPHLKRFQSAVISRIKVMANMDIAEKRLPQDGRISLRIKGEEIDVRVSTMPTVYGESVSLRLLMRSSGLLGMDKLGLLKEDEAEMLKLIRRPHGILLVTGPTGSGKSTSLYTWLHTINSVDKRIITVEDPIEYEMAGINQVQMKPEIGLTFAVGLRHILRQDPDVIMVGEVRDRETAEISIRAALTGHLVFSTLHTNDAAGAVTRLVDMGIEPFLVSSSLEGLVAQRLVRQLCHHCRRPMEADRNLLEEAGFPMDKLEAGILYEPVGCEECRQTGYRGRTGIYEIITMSDKLRSMVVTRASTSEVKAQALKEGMRTLRDDGWEKCLRGITTVEEVLRVTEEDDQAEE